MPGINSFWIDIYDAQENKLGAGPLTTALSWNDTNALNRVGTFRCVIPAGEAKLALIPMRGYLKCYMVRGATTELVSVGLVRRRRTQVRGGSSVVELSGPSYGDELNNRIVHDLELSELTLYRPAAAYWHIPEPEFEEEWNVDLTCEEHDCNEYQASLANNVFTDSWYFNRQWYGTTDPDERGFDTGNYFYWGNEEKFFQVTIHFTGDYTGSGSRNSRPASWELQYFNGDVFEWQTVEEWTDGTIGGNDNTFNHTGVIAWTEEELEDWTRTNHADKNFYWIRMHPTANLDDFHLSEVQILVHQQTGDDIQPILDYAPAGWDLTSTGGSTTGSYIQFSGETVLSALNKVAEQSGDHFRLSNRGRFVTWIRADDPPDSAGVLLTGSVITPSSATAQIVSLEKMEASEDVVTRIYPYGSGVAHARLKLEEIPIDPLFVLERMQGNVEAGSFDQYEVSYEDNYIENVSATARWGLIEREVQFNEVEAIQEDAKGENSAAIQLFNAAWYWLKSHSEAQEDTYRVSVVGLDVYPYPGQTYRIIYQEERDGTLTVNVQGSFVATDVEQALTGGGPLMVNLTLTNNVLRRTMVTGQTRLGRIEQAIRHQTKRQRTAQDNVLKQVNERHSRPWILIESYEGVDLEGDISPLARAMYRTLKDHNLMR